MSVKDEIIKYINTEKDLSRYRLNTLNKIKQLTISQQRLKKIEEEFVNLPLEFLEFEDVADVATAISIYKTSRFNFYQIYNIEKSFADLNSIKSVIESKINFIKKTATDYMINKPKETNLVQNKSFYDELVEKEAEKNSTSFDFERKRLEQFKIEELNNLESVILSKKRARLQAAYYSIGKYLKESLDSFSYKINDTYINLLSKSNELDNIIKNIPNNVFKYYNEGLSILSLKLKGTMGENPSLLKVHYLQNVLKFDSAAPAPIHNSELFSNKNPILGNIVFGSKKIISKSSELDAKNNTKNKVFGILLPIPHKGNEKMTPWYKEIILDGKNISHLFSDSFSNIKAIKGGQENYYKGLMLEPFWKLVERSENDPVSKYVLAKLSGLDLDTNFNDNKIIDQINNNLGNFYSISKESLTYAAQTRSEEECLLEIKPIIDGRISEIIMDFESLPAV